MAVQAGYSLVVVRGLLIAVASLVAEHGLWSVGSVVTARGPLWHVKSSWTGDQTCVTCIGGEFLTTGPLGHPVFFLKTCFGPFIHINIYLI